MKTCSVCDESTENYMYLNGSFYCIKCYDNSKSNVLERLDNLDGMEELEILKRNAIDEEYHFAHEGLIGEPFELVGEERDLLEWIGNYLVIKDIDVFKFLQSKTDCDLAKENSIISHISQSGVKYSGKAYAFNKNAIFSYFFAAHKPATMQKLSRNKDHFYLLGWPMECSGEASKKGEFHTGSGIYSIKDAYIVTSFVNTSSNRDRNTYIIPRARIMKNTK